MTRPAPESITGSKPVKRVLMIAFHFPPFFGSSGLQRTVSFCRFLPRFGWEPIVLTVDPRAFEKISTGEAATQIPPVHVRRSFVLDTARDLSIRGAYPRFLARPDRWWSWIVTGVPAGMRLIRHFRPQVLWSTYPIATTHELARRLAIRSGLPWVADCRDAMVDADYPRELVARSDHERIERATVLTARRVVLTTQSSLRMYADRYPDIDPSRWACVRNGYNEEDFLEAEQRADRDQQRARSRLILLHSGLLDPTDRDPVPFLDALALLRDSGFITSQRCRIVFRASGHDDFLRGHILSRRLEDIVACEPGIPYRAALAEMLDADALLLFQNTNCNHLVPAKLYEYLRAGRPILAITDPRGETAAIMHGHSATAIADIGSVDNIAGQLERLLLELQTSAPQQLSRPEAREYSRERQAGELAHVFESVCDERLVTRVAASAMP